MAGFGKRGFEKWWAGEWLRQLERLGLTGEAAWFASHMVHVMMEDLDNFGRVPWDFCNIRDITRRLHCGKRYKKVQEVLDLCLRSGLFELDSNSHLLHRPMLEAGPSIRDQEKRISEVNRQNVRSRYRPTSRRRTVDSPFYESKQKKTKIENNKRGEEDSPLSVEFSEKYGRLAAAHDLPPFGSPLAQRQEARYQDLINRFPNYWEVLDQEIAKSPKFDARVGTLLGRGVEDLLAGRYRGSNHDGHAGPPAPMTSSEIQELENKCEPQDWQSEIENSVRPQH